MVQEQKCILMSIIKGNTNKNISKKAYFGVGNVRKYYRQPIVTILKKYSVIMFLTFNS